MADEPRTEGQRQEAPAGQAAPAIDEGRLAALMDERFKANLTTFYQDQQNQQAALEQQRAAQEQAQKDTFGQLVQPYVAPVAQALQFQNNDTRDYVDFYTSHPDAMTRKAEIEQKFREMASSGRAIPRDDINTWIVGRESIKRDREEAAAAALKASTLQAGVGQRGALMNKDPREMTQEELSEFLADISI
jgi:hypothetical protein